MILVTASHRAVILSRNVISLYMNFVMFLIRLFNLVTMLFYIVCKLKFSYSALWYIPDIL
ncbi:hypothetical protein VDT1_0849 [Vibrio sp. 16]|nr:hypothetical protein VDT1_0849 [Vibrio sp. 16]